MCEALLMLWFVMSLQAHEVEGQTCSLFQDRTSTGLQRATDPKGLTEATRVSNFAKKEHFASKTLSLALVLVRIFS